MMRDEVEQAIECCAKRIRLTVEQSILGQNLENSLKGIDCVLNTLGFVLRQIHYKENQDGQ